MMYCCATTVLSCTRHYLCYCCMYYYTVLYCTNVPYTTALLVLYCYSTVLYRTNKKKTSRRGTLYSIHKTQEKLFCRSLKQAAASADVVHQRQLLLAAAASGSSREGVSHDARRPPFVCTHAGPDTYLVQREIPRFTFPTSNRAKTEQLLSVLCYSSSGS